MEYRPEDIVKQTMDAINVKIRNMNKLNIIVVGKSGVGKSTLINSVFREDLADTGIGRPVTQSIRRIEKKNFPLVIYDTPGFELGKNQQEQVKSEVMKLIRDGLAGKDVNKAIHTSGTASMSARTVLLTIPSWSGSAALPRRTAPPVFRCSSY